MVQYFRRFLRLMCLMALAVYGSSDPLLPRANAVDPWPTGTMRIAQSIHLGKMSKDLATSIGSKLASAPNTSVPGIAFSPALPYVSSANDAWTNAKTVISSLPAKRRILIVHLGHHKTEGYASLATWADKFFDNVLKEQRDSTFFYVSPGNEYNDSSVSFETAMTTFTNQLVTRWKNDKDIKSIPIANLYAHVRLLKYKGSSAGSLNGFQVDTEYHLPESGENNGASTRFPGGYTLLGNDGQTISGFPASKNNKDLFSIAESSYLGSNFCKGRNATLWLPPLHRWKYNTSAKKYIASENTSDRVDPTGDQRTAMLNAIERFAKAP